MPNPITGLTVYSPEGGSTRLAATKDGAVWTWDGTNLNRYTGATISTNTLTFMQQAGDKIYGTDTENRIFRFDGTTAQSISILAADGVTEMSGINDLLYFFDRLWFARGDFIYYSDITNVENISMSPLQIRRGAGDQIIRLMGYRNAYLLVFKGSTAGIGSISIFDVSANDPNAFLTTPTPLEDRVAIGSPHSIVKLSGNTGSDVLFWTQEGYRYLPFTALDKLTGPSLPITDNIPDIIGSINHSASGAIHANVFDDEILLWLPTGSSFHPDLCAGNSRKIPGNQPQEGWVKYDMMPATCSAVAALAGDTRPQLYIGTANGGIQKAFANAYGTHTYREIGKRIDHGNYDKDKGPLKIFVNQDKGALGTMRNFLLFEDNESRRLKDQVFGNDGIGFPILFPVIFPASGIQEEPRDLHYDASDIAMRRGKDIRYKMETEGFPKMLTYLLQSTIENYRYVKLNKDTSGTIAATDYAEAELSAADYQG